MGDALTLTRVSKRYAAGVRGCSAHVHALRDVSLRATAGELVGVVGAAGAGKTTLLLCAAGLLRPDAGEVRWFGSETRVSPRDVAYVPVSPTHYPFLTVRETLECSRPRPECAGTDLSGVSSRVAEAVDRAALARHLDRPVAELGGGIRRRLALAQALLSAPRILLLDEITSGVEPAAVRELQAVLRSLVAEGMTIIIASRGGASLADLVSHALALAAGEAAGVLPGRHLGARRALELEVERPMDALDRLRPRYAAVASGTRRVRLDLNGANPEEALSLCRDLEVRVLASRVVSEPARPEDGGGADEGETPADLAPPAR